MCSTGSVEPATSFQCLCSFHGFKHIQLSNSLTLQPERLICDLYYCSITSYIFVFVDVRRQCVDIIIFHHLLGQTSTIVIPAAYTQKIDIAFSFFITLLLLYIKLAYYILLKLYLVALAFFTCRRQ